VRGLRKRDGDFGATARILVTGYRHEDSADSGGRILFLCFARDRDRDRTFEVAHQAREHLVKPAAFCHGFVDADDKQIVAAPRFGHDRFIGGNVMLANDHIDGRRLVPLGARFLGGRDNDGSVYAYAPMAQVMAHEFGHVIASRASLGDQFYKWVAESDTEPFTRYAASNPQTEFFPEAFALYLLDPGWIQVNYPDLFVRARAYASRPPDHW